MITKWMFASALAAALSGLVGCGGEGSGSAAPDKGKGSTTAAASAASPKKGDAPGSAALQNPEENYVATGVEIGCLGIELDGADAFNKKRSAALSAHAYTEESWKAASKQYGAKSGEAIVTAMEKKCPP